jgi:hypothetical protein
MKINSLFIVIALLAFLVGCDDDPTILEHNDGGQGSIVGKVILDPDIPGTVAGTVVQLFCSTDAVCANSTSLTVVVGENGEFAFNGICCGTHYLGLWKDNDANGVISPGDFSFDRSNPVCCCVQKDAADYHSLSPLVVR